MYRAYLGTYVPIVYFIKICFIQGAELKIIFLQLILAEITCQLFKSPILRRQSVNVLYLNSSPESTKRDTKQSCVKGIQVFQI